MALGPGESPGGLCVIDQEEELGVTLPSGQPSQGLQVPYLSKVGKFAGEEVNQKGCATCLGHPAR